MRQLLLLFIPLLSFGQIPIPTEQMKVLYSLEYKKVPFKMKLFKKHLPKKIIEYHSKIGVRDEVNLDMKILGEHMINSTISVVNDNLAMNWIKTTTLVNDSLVDDQFIEKIHDQNQVFKAVVIGNKKKQILGYNCVNFSCEDDSSKTEGFLTPEITGRKEFQNHGLPLEFKTTSKTENFVVITKAQAIEIEPLNQDLFFLTKE